MRVTNTMMTNNAMINMAKNKEAYNKYLEQYTTQKKIQRPSDDPVVAVRSLKFRTRITELNQYLGKNVPDAISWTSATEECLSGINDKLIDMADYCEQAANGTLETDDRATILAALEQFRGNIYEEYANADNAGRYLFTGYRTDVSLLFDESQSNVTYNITEELSAADINPLSYAYGGAEYTTGNTASEYAADAPQYLSTHRMTLAYKNADAEDITLSYVDTTGALQNVTVTTKKVVDNTIYNEHYKPDADEVYFVPETGEIIFGDDIYAAMSESKDIKVQYTKTNFEKNDIRPEHYYDCVATNLDTGVVKNYSEPEEQDISYQINFSQSLKVNSLACESIDASVGRAIDNIAEIMNELNLSEAALADAEKKITDCNPNDTSALEALQQLKEQINNKITLQETMLTNAYTSTMTVCKKAQDTLNVALADLGARMNRLDATKKKLEEQEVSFTEALSENENADLGKAYIEYNQADLLYQATLQATAQSLGNTLLDFI